ncbi:MAG: nitroreductase family protein [Chloroflexi bacterium]|nr:nitroreductase family protein [Chloroflexota bacterium]
MADSAREARHAFLRTRRSVRRFEPRPVPEEVLRRVLDTARWAPSAHNRQPWRWVVLGSPQVRAALADAMAAAFRRDLEADGLPADEIQARVQRSRQRLLTAPVALLLAADLSVGDPYPDPARQRAERLMLLQSTALAGLQMLLAAHAEGLGGVWTCGPVFVPDLVREVLDLPPAWEPQALFYLGYPARRPDPPPRQPLDAVVRWM